MSKKLIEQLEKLTGKKVILEDESVSLSKEQIENLAKRAFILTLNRTAVKEVYKKHFAALLQGSNVIPEKEIAVALLKKHNSKIMELYDKFTIEKDLLIS